MDKKYYDALISEMKVLLDGQKMLPDGDIFKNNTKAVKVDYDDASHQFVLSIADIEEDRGIGDFKVLTSWLFEENQNERDAATVGVDFADTLRNELGIKKASSSGVNVELPSAEKGDSVTITALTQKLLSIFPEFKDDYKADVAHHGKFLYFNFYKNKFMPAIREMLINGAKKQNKKLFDMLSEMYVQGDDAVSDTVVALICGAVYGEDSLYEKAITFIDENKHLCRSVNEMMAIIKKNKKAKIAIID